MKWLLNKAFGVINKQLIIINGRVTMSWRVNLEMIGQY